LNIRIDPLILEAAASVINYFDTRFIWLLEQNVFWLQITVNYPMISLIFKGLQNLDGKSSYQAKREPLKIVIFYKLVKVDA
jgi:hypothetical protein